MFNRDQYYFHQFDGDARRIRLASPYIKDARKARSWTRSPTSMFNRAVLLSAALSFGLAAAAALDSTAGLGGIYALAKRRVPSHAHVFSFSLVEGDNDAFVVSDTHQDGIHVECNTVSACARGLYT